MPLPRDYQPVETLMLQQTKFALRQAIEDELGINADIQAYQDEWAYRTIVELRTQNWSHRLPPETKTETTTLAVKEWESAWQLWKHNHSNSRWFGWINRRWPAKKTGETNYQATVSFDMDKRVLFPDCKYPTNLGSPYYRVALSNPVWEWTGD
jgi:hypothetical protein